MEKKEKKFGIKEYKEIHDKVIAYKNGDNEAIAHVIDEFRAFLNKFLQLLKFGKFELENYSIRNFILLFADNPESRVSIKQHNHSPNKARIASSAIAGIMTSIFEGSTPEDIENDLIVILLNMCSKYKDDKPSFHNYVKRNFHFYAFRYFEKMARDPIARRFTVVKVNNNKIHKDSAADSIFSYDMIDSIIDESYETDSEQIDNCLEVHYYKNQTEETVINTDEVSIYEDEFLDENWVNGITCNSIFKTLSPMERYILAAWYIEGQTDTDIADHFGLCRGTVNKKRARAKLKLEEVIKKHRLYRK